MTQLHHIIPRQRIRTRLSDVRIKAKRFEVLTEGEERLLNTPLSCVYADSRNLVRLTKREHERHHTGTLRLDPSKLPLELWDFAAEYALENALKHELGLLGATAQRMDAEARAFAKAKAERKAGAKR